MSIMRRCRWALVVAVFVATIVGSVHSAETDYNVVNDDGSFKFGLSTNDEGGHYHNAVATSDQVVRGRYGSRSAATNRLEEVTYSAGPRGYRARGPSIHRKMDLSQVPRGGPRGSIDDPLADPSDDPSYAFRFRTADYQRREDSDRTGRVTGLYSYLDDIGDLHSVRYAAGAGIGYQVSNAVPDTPALVRYNAPLYKTNPAARGKVSYERGPGAQYKFISTSPDQRRSESTGADGITRGSYSYLDDKGVQRTVQYIAGAGIGYRVVQSTIGVVGSHVRPPPPQFGIASSQSGDVSDADGSGFKADASSPFGSRRKSPNSGAFGSGASGSASFGTSFNGGKAEGSSSAKQSGKEKGSSSFGGSNFGANASGFGNRNSNVASGSSGSNSNGQWNKGSGSTNSGSDGQWNKGSGSAVGNANHNGQWNGGSKSGSGSSIGASSTPNNGQWNKGTSSENNKPSFGSGTSFNTKNNDLSSRERDHLHSGSGNAISRNKPNSGAYNPSNQSSANTGNSAFGSKSEKPFVTGNPSSLAVNRQRDWSAQGRDSTIVTNVGKWYVGLPPGTAVRAHVQNIDLLPLGGRSQSPSEALRKDEHRSLNLDAYDY